MIPAVALADEAPEVQDEASLELLAVSQVTAFNNGTVTIKDTVTGKTYTSAVDKNGKRAVVTVQQNTLGEGHAFEVVGVSVQNTDSKGAVSDVALTADKDYTVSAFVAGNTSTALNPAGITAAGEYTVDIAGAAKGDVAYNGGTIAVKVVVKAPTVTAAAFEPVTGEADNVSDTTFTWNGAAQTVGLAANGVVIYDGQNLQDISGQLSKGIADTDFSDGYGIVYSVQGEEPNATQVTAALSGASKSNAPVAGTPGGAAPIAVGKYVIYLVKSDDQSIIMNSAFEVGEINLADAGGSAFAATSAAAPTVGDVVYDGKKLSDILKETGKEPADMVGFEWAGAKDADGNDIASFKVDATNGATPGKYTYTITDKKGASDKGVVGQNTVTFDVVGKTATADAYIAYDETNVTAGTAISPAFNIDKGQKYDPSLVTVNVTSATGDLVDPSTYTITYTNSKNKEVTVNDINTTADTYTATISIDAAQNNYEIGGDVTFKITTQGATVAASTNLYFTYNDKTTTKVNAVYDGSDVLSKIGVVLKDNKGNVIPATDYKVKVTDVATGGEVTEAIDYGTYNLVVSSDKYTITGNDADKTLVVTIAQAEITDVRVVPDATLYVGTAKTETPVLTYTGSELTPAFEYTVADDPTDKEAVWTAFPEGLITATYTKGGNDAKLKDTGDYEATLKFTVANKNYKWGNPGTTEKCDITVSDKKQFEDVANSAWYADAVASAYNNGYMNGYSGTKLFGPNDNLTRAQTAIVLFNMAGGEGNETDGWTNGDAGTGYLTKFADVDAKAYYAEAIQWATNRGIVSGYNATTFGPNDPVSREQFALMLQRYAKAMGKDVTGDASALSAYADAAAVDSWATDGVAWAVANKVMGVDTTVINPLGKITRAEAAAMTTRYQPEKLNSAVA